MAAEQSAPSAPKQVLGGLVQDGAALSLSWTCGLNKDSVGAVKSLDSNEVFYPAAHTGVIYDSGTGVQRLLQGGINIISEAAVLLGYF